VFNDRSKRMFACDVDLMDAIHNTVHDWHLAKIHSNILLFWESGKLYSLELWDNQADTPFLERLCPPWIAVNHVGNVEQKQLELFE
jgi:hypothetical protein